MVMQKDMVISEDGNIEASIEKYKDNSTSVIKVTARFKGRTGVMTFTAREDDVNISFASDEMSMNAKNIHMTASEAATVSSAKTIINASSECLVSSDGQIIIQALGGILDLISSKVVNIGAAKSAEIKAVTTLLLQCVQKIEMVAAQVNIKTQSMNVGTGIFPVARVGIDKVDTTTGMIIGPGSFVLRTD